MDPRTTTSLATFRRRLDYCVRYQGIRATARKLGWHPSKVSRSLDRFDQCAIADLVALAESVDTFIRFVLPEKANLTPPPRGRPTKPL